MSVNYAASTSSKKDRTHTPREEDMLHIPRKMVKKSTKCEIYAQKKGN